MLRPLPNCVLPVDFLVAVLGSVKRLEFLVEDLILNKEMCSSVYIACGDLLKAQLYGRFANAPF